MKMTKFVAVALSMIAFSQAAQAITVVARPVVMARPAMVSVAKPAPVVVAKAAPAPVVVAKTTPAVSLTKSAVPTKTTPAIADDVVTAKAVVPNTIAMASVGHVSSSTNKCSDKEKAKRLKECKAE